MLTGMGEVARSDQPTAGASRRDHPSMAELRAVAQPPAVLNRRNSEHWAGALYLRKASIYLTRALLPTGIAANAVTWWIAIIGVGAAAVLLLPGWWPFLVAAVLVQVSIMVDCTDGEIARWRGQSSAAGVYIDRVCHYLVEAALPIALGFHLDGGLHLDGSTAAGGWTILGLATAILVLLKKAFGDLVFVARNYQGWPKLSEAREIAAPRSAKLRSVRAVLHYFPFFRAFGAIEYSLILFVIATADLLQPLGHEGLLRIWAIVSVPLAALTALGYLVAILASSRLLPPPDRRN